MTKRINRKFRLLKFYEEDLFGTLVIKDPLFEQSLWKGYKNLKINNILFEKVEERVEKRLYYKKHGKRQEFYYRIDIGKPKRRKRKLSIFAKRLKLRHKIRKFASQMNVRQFRNYVKKSSQFNKLYLFFVKSLETRLDFLLYRMNFVENSTQGRFLINHGNFLLNGKQVRFASQQLKNFEYLSILNKELFFKNIIQRLNDFKIFINLPLYVEVNFRILTGILLFIPKPNQIPYPSNMKSEILASIGKRFKS